MDSGNPITPVSQCQCRGDEMPGPNGSFWCACHQVRKTQHWRHLCSVDDSFRQAWNEGRGPGQGDNKYHSKAAKPDGLGDKVAGWLSKVGVTEENYKAVKAMFGLPPTCNCAGRREWLNKVGAWLSGKET